MCSDCCSYISVIQFLHSSRILKSCTLNHVDVLVSSPFFNHQKMCSLSLFLLNYPENNTNQRFSNSWLSKHQRVSLIASLNLRTCHVIFHYSYGKHADSSVTLSCQKHSWIVMKYWFKRPRGVTLSHTFAAESKATRREETFARSLAPG